MKKILFITILFLANPIMKGQSSFNASEFLGYREQVKDLKTKELLGKYPLPDIYYSERKNKSLPESFQFFDSIDLHYALTPYEKELISDNHFMISERLSHSSFAEAFVNIYSRDLPLFLSSDFFLHALHCSYDIMLRDLEWGVLEPNLSDLLQAMRDQLPLIYAQNSSRPEIEEAIKDVDLYLSIAFSLLKDADILPIYDRSGKYDLLTNAIYDQQDPLLSIGLFSEHQRRIDISQFKPRGHYTEEFWAGNELRNLKNYFRAMMWLGRIDFWLTAPPVGPGEPEWSVEDLKRMSRAAMILNRLLNKSGKKNLFRLHEKIMEVFIGPDDNLNPFELDRIITELQIDPEELSINREWELFTEKIRESDDYGQKIISNFFMVDADRENPAELPVSYRFFGQKFLIDSYIFSEVVYDRIYYEGREIYRMMPDPLDVMFVVGNNNTLPILKEELDAYNYGYKLDELRYLTDSFDPEFWGQSLYNTWLNAIRKLSPSSDNEDLPYFMKTTEWQLEKLNTQLSSWAELRHDNVLYAKQSYTGGTSCSFPYVYIEPYPSFYETLADFSEQAADFFAGEPAILNFANDIGLVKFYRNFGKHMGRMEELAIKELKHQNFSGEDIAYLKTFINSAMASGPDITGWYNELFYDKYKGMVSDHLVVDVHTQPTDESGNVVGKVFHAGTGNINLGVFCTESPFGDHQPAAFVGPVMSFHTRIEDHWKRLTDDEWAEFFSFSTEPPSRPDWVAYYLASPEGTSKLEGAERNIPGITYLGTDIDPVSPLRDIAYLIAFPNPSSNQSSIRFVLNNSSKVQAEIYDFLGKRRASIINEKLPAGEHKKEFNLGEFNAGLYFINLRTGYEQRTIKLIVR